MTGAATPSAFDRVLDDVGAAIIHGTMPAGSTETVDSLIARTGASRSIVREATRVLASLGMISAGRRVGLRIRDRADWDVLDPLVIRWRLAGPDRAAQLDELRALRRAVEPEAARAAARSSGDRAALDAVADRLREAGGGADAHRASSPDRANDWAEADRALHGLVLARSGNAMFRRLQAVVDEALAERRALPPDPHDVALHVAVAEAVAAGAADAAADAMRQIVDRTS
jgi:DNA-binding FadR family transcriptional regulator